MASENFGFLGQYDVCSIHCWCLCVCSKHAQKPLVELEISLAKTRPGMVIVINLFSSTATMCREFLRKSRQRDKVEPNTETDAPKEQPLPSAASIRPLLLKASALLASVRPCPHKQCVLVGTKVLPRCVQWQFLYAARLGKQRSWWHGLQPCMLPWHQGEHLLVVKSARA